MNELILLVKLLCAHVCSDFVFQTDGIHRGKSLSGLKGLLYQLLHALIHAVAAYLFVADWDAWVTPLVIFITHFIIDTIKYRYCHQGIASFIVDQIAHVIVIAVLWYALYGGAQSVLSHFASTDVFDIWCLLTAYLLVLKPSSILLGLFLKQWTPESDHASSLPKAGQWIGYLERVLILTFILINSLEGVGFLLAAKSVFRFGELNKANEIKTTEYVLIGTMSSFALAILIAIAARSLIVYL